MRVEDHDRSGRPSSSWNDENIEKIRQKINQGRRFTIDEISEQTGVGELGMCCENVQNSGDRVTSFSRSHGLDYEPLFGVLAIVPQPACQSDLPPSDFFLLSKMKKILKRNRFDDVVAVKTTSQRILDNVKVEEFQKCFKHRDRRSDKCIHSN